MKLIKEELDNLNLDIETKARETVNPVYADAIRQLRVNDEKREAARKLPATPKTEEPKPIKNELLKKMHLSESLFDNEEDLKPLTDEERDHLDYLRRKEKVTSLDKEELWELIDLEEREDLIDDEYDDDLDESLEEKKDTSTNLFTRLSDKLDANGYTLFAPIRNEAKVVQRTKDDENFRYDYKKAKQILDELEIKYDVFEGESYKKPFIKVYFKDEDLYEGLKENKESVYDKLISYLDTL